MLKCSSCGDPNICHFVACLLLTMFVLSTSSQNLVLPASCYQQLIGSKLIKNMLTDTHVDLSTAVAAAAVDDINTGGANNTVVIPLPDSYQWAIANSYVARCHGHTPDTYNWLQGESCHTDKACRLAECLRLANFLEDEDYFDSVVDLLVGSWFRDLTAEVMVQLNEDVTRQIYLHLAHPFIPKHYRHNSSFMTEWLQRNVDCYWTSNPYKDGLDSFWRTLHRSGIVDDQVAVADDDDILTASDDSDDDDDNSDHWDIRLEVQGFTTDICWNGYLYKIRTQLHNTQTCQNYYLAGKTGLYPDINSQLLKAPIEGQLVFTTDYYPTTTAAVASGLSTSADDNNDDSTNSSPRTTSGGSDNSDSSSSKGSCCKHTCAAGPIAREYTQERDDCAIDAKSGPDLAWWPNGTVKHIKNYVDGRCDGEQREFFNDGKPKLLANYREGMHVGCYQQWFPGCELPYISEYYDDDGSKTGMWLHYNYDDDYDDMDCRVLGCGWYRGGKRVGRWKVYRVLQTMVDDDPEYPGHLIPAANRFQLYKILDSTDGYYYLKTTVVPDDQAVILTIAEILKNADD